MVNRKSNPINHPSGRRPLDSIDSLSPSSLPPELGSLDMSWDDDPNSTSTIDLLQHSDYDLDVDAGERTTAIPEIPIDQLVQVTMAEADAKESADTERGLGSGQPASPWLGTPGSKSAEVAPSPTEETNASRDRRRAFAQREPVQTQPAPARGVVSASSANTPTSSKAIAPNTAGMVEIDREGSAPPSAQEFEARPAPGYRTLPPVGMAGNAASSPPTLRNAESESLRHQMKDRYATGDFSGALELAETLLDADRDDLEAQRFATSCRDVLTQMLLSRIGSPDQTVMLALTPEEMRWLSLDHRAGFFLSLVDGCSTIEELLDISGMARLESLRILSALVEQRVVRLLPR